MRESESDLTALQELLDASYRKAGSHLRSIFEERLVPSAQEFVELLDGIFEMHLAVVRKDGSPIVAPVDGIFFKGRIWFGFPAKAYRGELIRRDPRVSASYTRDSFAFIVHGTSREVTESDPIFAEYEDCIRALYVEAHGPKWEEWYAATKSDEDYNGWIEPTHFFVKR